MQFTYSDRGLVHYPMVGSIKRVKQTGYWRGSWAFYIEICRQLEEKNTGPKLGFWNLKASFNDTLPSTRLYLLQQRATLPFSSSTTLWLPNIQVRKSMGVILFQTTTPFLKFFSCHLLVSVDVYSHMYTPLHSYTHN